jgi:hypothetical protein
LFIFVSFFDVKLCHEKLAERLFSWCQ